MSMSNTAMDQIRRLNPFPNELPAPPIEEVWRRLDADQQGAPVRDGSNGRRSALTRLPTFGVALTAISVATAVGIAFLAIVLLGHRRPSNMPRPVSTASPAVTTPRATSGSRGERRVLYGDRIASFYFGERPAAVAVGLSRLFGPPASPYSAARICGSDHQMDWVGLHVRSTGQRRLFRATLVLYFKHSRFVGYSYVDDQYIARGAPETETSIPLGSPAARQVLRGPRLTLATGNGLTPGDGLMRARRLYGHPFVQTTAKQGTPPNPRLGRVPVWRADTATGRIYGAIYGQDASASFYSSPEQTIGTISAGSIPNTPCH